MDVIGSREIDLVDDLESGETTSTDEEESKQMDWDEVAGQKESMLREKGLNLPGKSSFISGDQGVKMLVGDVRAEAGRESMGRKKSGEKKKKKGSEKPPKPPLPPGGPSLNDAADIRLVREISELSRLRRARYERIKALQKMRSDKACSSKSNLFAMIITVLFFFVIIFQGTMDLLF